MEKEKVDITGKYFTKDNKNRMNTATIMSMYKGCAAFVGMVNDIIYESCDTGRFAATETYRMASAVVKSVENMMNELYKNNWNDAEVLNAKYMEDFECMDEMLEELSWRIERTGKGVITNTTFDRYLRKAIICADKILSRDNSLCDVVSKGLTLQLDTGGVENP